MDDPVIGKNETPIEFWRRVGWEYRLSQVLKWNYTTIIEVKDFAIIHASNSFIGVHKPCTYTFSYGYGNFNHCFCKKSIEIPDIIRVTLMLTSNI